MRTGVSYLGSHDPRHMRTDLDELRDLGCDDVLLAAQENDFVYLTGKLDFLPGLARERGLRPIAIFWGVLNVFGGGRSSQFLLDHPDGRQVGRDGRPRPQGCYNNPRCVAHVQGMLDRVAGLGFEGYFIDEPTPIDCHCPACRGLFEQWSGGDLAAAAAPAVGEFRGWCVLHYIQTISDYVKRNHPAVETMCCLMEQDRTLWRKAAEIATLDNLGSDIYWTNNDRPVEEMTPMVRELADVCRRAGKRHHEWFECWGTRAGREGRIVQQGEILVREKPDALYVWAYRAQVGTSESAADPEAAWSAACRVLRLAKQTAGDR